MPTLGIWETDTHSYQESYDPGDFARLREDPQLYQSSISGDTLLTQFQKGGGSEAHVQR